MIIRAGVSLVLSILTLMALRLIGMKILKFPHFIAFTLTRKIQAMQGFCSAFFEFNAR